MVERRYLSIKCCNECRDVIEVHPNPNKTYWGCKNDCNNIISPYNKTIPREIPDINKIPEWCPIKNGETEWEMTLVYAELKLSDGSIGSTPKFTVYQCPVCGGLADKQYDNCPNPFCHVPLDED